MLRASQLLTEQASIRGVLPRSPSRFASVLLLDSSSCEGTGRCHVINRNKVEGDKATSVLSSLIKPLLGCGYKDVRVSLATSQVQRRQFAPVWGAGGPLRAEAWGRDLGQGLWDRAGCQKLTSSKLLCPWLTARCRGDMRAVLRMLGSAPSSSRIAQLPDWFL